MVDFLENQEIKIDNLQLTKNRLILKHFIKELLFLKNEFVNFCYLIFFIYKLNGFIR